MGVKKPDGFEINGVRWDYREDIGKRYIHDYRLCWEDVEAGVYDEHSMWRFLIQNDIWFILYFVLRKDRANHPFLVECCRDLQYGPRTNTVDLWFRGALKTTIISVAETIQDICNDPEQRIAIFSYTKTAARKILKMVKQAFEESDLLKTCFPDVLWTDPEREAPYWSEENGIVVRRKGIYREATVSAWGLLEGMPTGDHYTKRIYDDVVTEENADSVVENEKLKENYDLSHNLSTFSETDRVRVVGTPYRYDDALMYIQGKKDPVTEQPLYHVRKKTATVDGTFNGASVFHPESALAEARTNKRTFAAQQLIDPTPVGDVKLNPEFIKEVAPHEIPKNLWKFMTVDPAGLRKSDSRDGDSWAMLCFGIVPERSDFGASDLYILDLVIDTFDSDDAMKEVCDMYCRNGRIWKLGVEKVGISTMEVHIAQHLFTRGRIVNTENGSLQILRPGGRDKQGRIETNLEWPLNNGKIFISKAIPVGFRERLKLEMRKFPFWKDDGLDALSYAYDLVKDYRFSRAFAEETERRDPYRDNDKDKDLKGWLVV